MVEFRHIKMSAGKARLGDSELPKRVALSGDSVRATLRTAVAAAALGGGAPAPELAELFAAAQPLPANRVFAGDTERLAATRRLLCGQLRMLIADAVPGVVAVKTTPGATLPISVEFVIPRSRIRSALKAVTATPTS
jgi:hypothetical protein